MDFAEFQGKYGRKTYFLPSKHVLILKMKLLFILWHASTWYDYKVRLPASASEDTNKPGRGTPQIFSLILTINFIENMSHVLIYGTTVYHCIHIWKKKPFDAIILIRTLVEETVLSWTSLPKRCLEPNPSHLHGVDRGGECQGGYDCNQKNSWHKSTLRLLSNWGVVLDATNTMLHMLLCGHGLLSDDVPF
jgi:hypothetical protein